MSTTSEVVLEGSVDDVAKSLLVTPEANEDNQPETEVEASDATEDIQTDDVEADVEEVDASAIDDSVEDTNEQEIEIDDGQEEPQTYRVKVDGEEVETTLDDLKRSFSGQGYIQKKMGEVASLRKEAEGVYQSLQAERETLKAQMQTYQNQLSQTGIPAKPAKELMSTDPIAYFEQMEMHRDGVEQQQQLKAEQTQLDQKAKVQNDQAMKTYLAEQAQLLQQSIPAFADTKKAPVIRQELVDVGTAYGYSAEEVSQIMDHRAIKVLYDAAQFRKATSNKNGVAKKVSNARPVLRPGAKRTDGDAKAKAQQKIASRMKQTGSVEDVARFLIGD